MNVRHAHVLNLAIRVVLCQSQTIIRLHQTTVYSSSQREKTFWSSRCDLEVTCIFTSAAFRSIGYSCCVRSSVQYQKLRHRCKGSKYLYILNQRSKDFLKLWNFHLLQLATSSVSTSPLVSFAGSPINGRSIRQAFVMNCSRVSSCAQRHPKNPSSGWLLRAITAPFLWCLQEKNSYS